MGSWVGSLVDKILLIHPDLVVDATLLCQFSQAGLIILGDARGNRTDPRTDIMGRLSLRAKRIIWLNPEYRSAWGTGDSDMYRYAPFCNLVTMCNTLRHLERVISDILEDAA